jgi:hypothetical protein
MASKFSVFGVAVGTILPIAFACGGDDSPHHISPQPDAAPDAMEPCKGQTEYSPAFGSDNTQATDYPRVGSDPDNDPDFAPHNLFFIGALDTNDPGDYLYLDLYELYGAFDGGDIKTGTFPLTGDDAAYSTCGACVYLGAKVDADGNVDDYYFARSGLLNLTSVTGRLTGSIQNVMFYRVKTDADGFPSDDATFDCESKIMNATFDTEIVVDTGSAAPSTPSR